MLVSNHTIRLDDYSDIVNHTTFECEPLHADNTDGGVVTKPLIVSLTIPALRLSLLREAAQHLVDRIMHRGINGSTHPTLVFGHDTLATHPDFREGSVCGHEIPVTAPFYRVLEAHVATSKRGDASPLSYVVQLALQPAQLSDIFKFATVDMDWDPRPEGIARRLAARNITRRRLPITYDRTIAAMNINYDPNTRKAASSYDFASISCDDCYAYYTVGMKASVSFCALVSATSGYYAWDSSKYFPGSTTVGGSWGSRAYDGWKNDADTVWTSSRPLPPDCTAIGVAAPSVADLGFSAEAYVYGEAGMSFHLTARRWQTAGGTDGCTTGDIAQLPGCPKRTMLSPTTLPTISLVLGGVPVSIAVTLSMDGAATYSGLIDGSFNGGVKASITGVKLGGKLSMRGLPGSTGWSAANRPRFTLYNEFTPAWSRDGPDFTLTDIRTTIGVLLAPKIKLLVWGAYPLVSDSYVIASFSLFRGTKAASARRLNGAINATDRKLQTRTPDQLAAECVSSRVSLGASVEGNIGGFLDTVTYQRVIDAALTPFSPTLASVMNSFITPSSVMFARMDAPEFRLQPTDVIPTGCVPMAFTGPAATPAAAKDGFPLGAIIGIAVGGVLLLVGAAGGWYYFRRQAALGAAGKLASPPAGTEVPNPDPYVQQSLPKQPIIVNPMLQQQQKQKQQLLVQQQHPQAQQIQQIQQLQQQLQQLQQQQQPLEPQPVQQQVVPQPIELPHQQPQAPALVVAEPALPKGWAKQGEPTCTGSWEPLLLFPARMPELAGPAFPIPLHPLFSCSYAHPPPPTPAHPGSKYTSPNGNEHDVLPPKLLALAAGLPAGFEVRARGVPLSWGLLTTDTSHWPWLLPPSGIRQASRWLGWPARSPLHFRPLLQPETDLLPLALAGGLRR